MSQTYSLDEYSSYLNIIEQPRRIPTMKVIFEVCQCCKGGKMVWTEKKEQEFLMEYSSLINSKEGIESVKGLDTFKFYKQV